MNSKYTFSHGEFQDLDLSIDATCVSWYDTSLEKRVQSHIKTEMIAGKPYWFIAIKGFSCYDDDVDWIGMSTQMTEWIISEIAERYLAGEEQ